MKKLLVTGSSGLIGSEVCTYFARRGWEVHGLDNNYRAVLFGGDGDTRWIERRLVRDLLYFTHHEGDIRDRESVLALVREIAPDAVVHAAAQPSHDKAATIPFEDFDINAGGTLNLLEAVRRVSTSIPFVYMSTNKVYGDGPNRIQMTELATRWDYLSTQFFHGIDEGYPIDQSKHSLFGVSKASADLMVQEYGRYFGMPTACLRCGCLSGPNHSGVWLHGFLSYLVRCNLKKEEYTIYGYLGKQVRDNLHAEDVAAFIHGFVQAPRCAEVYNLGGGKAHTCSILEAFCITQAVTGIPMISVYNDRPRIGDHICYYSNINKARAHYPDWQITKGIPQTVAEIAKRWQT